MFRIFVNGLQRKNLKNSKNKKLDKKPTFDIIK